MYLTWIRLSLGCALALALSNSALAANNGISASGFPANTIVSVTINNPTDWFHNYGCDTCQHPCDGGAGNQTFSFTTDAAGHYTLAPGSEGNHPWTADSRSGTTSVTLNGHAYNVVWSASAVTNGCNNVEFINPVYTFTGSACTNGSSVRVSVTSTNRSAYPWYHDRGYPAASYYFDVQFWKDGESYYRIRLTTASWPADGVAHTNVVQAPPGELTPGTYTIHVNCSRL
jgi:hypothetical protein